MEALNEFRTNAVDMLHQISNLLKRKRHLIILILAAGSVILVGGKRRCFSIFIGELHQDFNVSVLELNWIGDSYAALGFFLMPAAGTLTLWLNHCYSASALAAAILIFVSCITTSFVPSPDWMFLTHTAIHGVGSALAMTSAALCVGEHFDSNHKLHVLATTLVSGGPYGAVLFCPIYAAWVRDYGWREAFRLMGVVFLVEIALAAAAYTSPKRQQQLQQQQYQDLDAAADSGRGPTGEEEEEEKVKDKKLSKNRVLAFCTIAEMKARPVIVVWFVQRVVHNISMYSVAMNMYDMQLDYRKGLESFEEARRTASNVQLCYSVGESLCFTIGVVLGDKFRGKLIYAYVAGTAVLSITTFAWQFMMSMQRMQYLLALLSGAAIGTGNTMLYATAEEVCDIEGAVAFPMTKMAAGVGMLLAPQLSGLIIDKLSFAGFFLVQSILAATSFVLLLIIALTLRSAARRQQQQQQQHLLQHTRMSETDGKSDDFAADNSAFNSN